MIQATSFAALAFAGLAAAGAQVPNSPPPLPVNAQIGGLHFPLTCEILGTLNQTFDVLATATGPSFGASGSEFYITDTVATIQVPEAVLNLAHKLGATDALANVTLYLNATNASPPEIMAFQGAIDLALPATGSATLRFPAGNGTLPNVGPFTLGEEAEPARLFLGTTQVTLDLRNSTGSSVSGPVTITCGKQNIEYVLAEISIDNSLSPTAVNIPSNGYVPDFPFFPLNTEYGFFRFPYNCVFGALGLQSLDLTIGGTIPTYFSPGQQFELVQSENFLRVPPAILKLAKEAYPNATTFYTSISDFQVLFTNADPPIFNAAATPLTASIDICGVSESDPLVIPVPQYGDLTLGPITAGDVVGNIVNVGIGNATAIAELRDADGNTLLDLDVTCTPVAYLELIGIAISDQSPDNYTLGVNNA